MFYLRLFELLQEAGVRYLVAGGVALNLHGVPRMTGDLDLAVALDSENLLAAIDALERAGFVASLPVPIRHLLDAGTRARWRDEKNLLAFPLHNPARPFEAVDLLVNLELDFEGAWERRAEFRVAGVALPVLSVHDLIELKRRAARPQDLSDADALVRVVSRREEKS